VVVHQPTDPAVASDFSFNLADAFEQLSVGVAIFDTSDSFCCLYHSVGFLAIASPRWRARGSIIGVPLAELLSPESYAQIRPIFEQVCTEGVPFTSDDFVAVMSWEPEADPRFFEWTLAPLRRSDGTICALIASGREITDQRRMQQELHALTLAHRERVADLEALLDAVPAVVWIAHDPHCQVITGSAVARRLLRMGSDRNLSKTAPDPTPTTHFRVLHAGVELDPEDLPVQRAASGVEIRDYEEELAFDDGTRLTLLGNATPLRDEQGNLRGAVAAFLDITERKLAEQERVRLYAAEQQARSEAEAALKIRDTFFTMAAHELKTPLTALLGQAQLIERRMTQGGNSSERDQRALRALTSHATRLNKLVDAMLDLTRIERGYLSLERAPVDMVAITGRVIAEIQPIYPKHYFRWHGPGTPLMTFGDALRLEQVIYNLVENAVKYSPRGGEVGVNIEAQDTMLKVSVCDQGIGIRESDIPHLFERFYRATAASERHIAGMGIGLYVVREIVTLHGGEVRVQSTEGEGSCFTVTLPLMMTG